MSKKYHSDYARLDEKTPMFHVTPGKNCRMYPYIWTKDCAEIYEKGKNCPIPYLCRANEPVDPNQKYNNFNNFFEFNLAGNPKNCSEPPAKQSFIGFTSY